jgi:alkylresorcinol/alkylpyrone synthase
MVGANRAAALAPGQPRVVATRSRLYPDTERAMGWDVVADVGAHEVGHLGAEDDAQAGRADIGWWVAHPGGPKVLEAMQDALEVEREALGVTWRSLDQIGNLSSASVLHVLADTLADHAPEPGSWGILMAMGPGFCLELVLLRAAE